MTLGRTSEEARNAPDDGGSATAAILVGLLLLAVPLAGCADGGGVDAGEEGMTAEDGLGEAEAVAEEWSGDAVLIGAAMFETGGDAPEEWPEDGPDFRSDDRIGDGYLPQWAYTFKDGEDRILVIVREDGETFRDDEPQQDAFMDAEIADWELDSTEAVETAREEDGDFASAVEADDAEVGYFLVGGEDGNETWVLDVQSEGGDEQITLVVDAHSGEVQRFGAAN